MAALDSVSPVEAPVRREIGPGHTLRRALRQYQRWWTLVAAFVVLLAAWEVVARVIGIAAFFPKPGEVGLTLITMMRSGELVDDMQASLARILLGFVIGSALAVPIGLLMGNIRVVRDFCEPYIEFFRYIPALSLVTVSLIWFGLGEASKVFLIVYATMFIVVVNTIDGVRAIPPIKYQAAEALGVHGWRLFLYVSFPATVPFILTGMRIAMGNAFAVIVAAEMIGAQSGLGYRIVYSRLVMRTDLIFLSIIALGFLGFMSDRLFRLLIQAFGRRYNPHW
jgi:ABC-type nitrate/sulfonate/bicarbonate transport system permease component